MEHNVKPLSHAYALEVSNGDEPAFSPIVSDGQWTSSIDAWMTALGYPSFKGYHRFLKKIIVLIYQAAMRGKRMRLFAYRVFLANLLKHLLEFTLHSERRKAAREAKKGEKLKARRALKVNGSTTN